MKKFLLFAFSVCLLSACSSGSEDIGNDIPKEDPPVAITLSAKSLTIDVKTKGPYTETKPTESAPLTARIISSQTAGDYTSGTGKLHSDGTMTFEDDEMTSYNTGATDPYYPADDTPLYFSGLYPATGWTMNPTTQAAIAFDGKTDVMYAGEPSSKKTTASTAPELTFNHMLTLLKVYVQADEADAITAWGNITKIELVGANGGDAANTITVTMGGTPTTAFTSVPEDEETPIPFYGASESTSEGTTTTTYADVALADADPTALTVPDTDEGEKAPLIAYAMVQSLPESRTADYTLKVYSAKFTTGREVGIKLMSGEDTAFSESTAGCSFNVTLTFRTTAITAMVTFVNAWQESGSAEEEVK